VSLARCRLAVTLSFDEWSADVTIGGLAGKEYMVRVRIQKRRTIAVVVGLLALSTGCSEYRLQRRAASPALSAPLAGRASICVFRPHGLGTSVISPVSDNGAIVGATDGSSYFCYSAEPGVHRIRTADAPPLAISARPGKRYFLAHDMNVGTDTLMRITAASAQQLSGWCGEVAVRAAPEHVAVLKRGDVARAQPSLGAPLVPEREVDRADDSKLVAKAPRRAMPLK